MIPAPDASNSVTPEFVADSISDATKRIDLLMTGVVIVMFTGFVSLLVTVIGMVIQSQKDREPQIIYNISSSEARDFGADRVLMRVGD